MKKVFLLMVSILLLVGGLFVFDNFRFNDERLHVVFCDVGQGDAIFVRTPNGKNMLIDGGPDRKVLNCLADNMPFWERTIDLMILTHPHSDHFVGMLYVIERYNITHFATEKLENKSGEFNELKKVLERHNIPVQYVSSGDKWIIDGEDSDVSLSILGPTKEFLRKTSPNGDIGDGKEFASLVMHLSYTNFDAIFTGDTQSGELEAIVEERDFKNNNVDILQAPHHGSRTGLNEEIVQQLRPQLAIISVGAFNRYNHPIKQTLDLLRTVKSPILRTDQLGDIEIIIDKLGWQVKKK